MKPVEFADGAVEIDASIVAEGLGIALPRLKEGHAQKDHHQHFRARDRCGSGPASPDFFFGHRRFRVVVDASGTIVQRSAVDYGDFTLPKPG
jgi:hypothetical protein